MFGRNFIGLEVRRQGLRAVSLKRRGRRRTLCGGQTLQLSEGVVSPTARELNVIDSEVFTDGVKEVLLPLAGREERVALCLPDAAGHIFLLDIDAPFKNRQQGVDIIRWQLKDKLPDIYRTIEAENMERVFLEKKPDIVIYSPSHMQPWDDAVRLALEYAEIEYDMIWDTDVIEGKLEEYDWLHLHHEDFTGQFGRFYASFKNQLWYQQDVAANEASARAGI